MAVPYQAIFEAAAAKYGIPANVLEGQAQIESNFNPGAVSPTGAQGISQFEPATAKSYGVQYGTSPSAVQSQIMGQAQFLKALGYNQNPSLALSKYNAGPGNPSAAGNYAAQVLAAAKKYGAGVTATGETSLATPKPVNASFTPVSSSAPNVFNALAGLEATRQQILANAAPRTVNPATGLATPTTPTPATSDPVASGWQALSNLFSSQQSVNTAQQKAINRLSQAAGSSVKNTGATIPGPAAANKILSMARSAIGGPYSQAEHSAAFTESASQVRKTGTDCSGFVSWLMGPDGLGIWSNALATPDIPSAPGIQKGPGRNITIWNNPLPGNSGHVFIQIDGQYFQSAGGGTGIQSISQGDAASMIRSGDNGNPYYALHPKGF